MNLATWTGRPSVWVTKSNNTNQNQSTPKPCVYCFENIVRLTKYDGVSEKIHIMNSGCFDMMDVVKCGNYLTAKSFFRTRNVDANIRLSRDLWIVVTLPLTVEIAKRHFGVSKHQCPWNEAKISYLFHMKCISCSFLGNVKMRVKYIKDKEKLYKHM